MKTPFSQMFRADPRAALAKARAELSATRASLRDLEVQRGEALAGAAEITAIRKIDRELEEARATVDLLEDRIVRLNKAVREAERQKLVAARDQALKDVIEPEFARVQTLAERLEWAIQELVASYASLQEAQRALNTAWPAAVPKPAYWVGFSLLDVEARICSAFRYAGGGRSITRLEEFVNLERDESLAAATKRQLATALSELQAVEIELPQIDDSDDDLPSAAAPEPVRGVAALATT
jgi:hypothetical protein